MRFPVVCDTNVLYPVSLADTLLRLGEVGVIDVHWSPEILGELERNLAPRIGVGRAARRVAAMQRAFPDALISGYEARVDDMVNDPKDRHVLAAAVHGGCEVIVTFNLKDFPAEALAPFGVEAVHPDEFLLDQLDLYPDAVRQSLVRQAASTARPALSMLQLVEAFEKTGLKGFAVALRRSWFNL